MAPDPETRAIIHRVISRVGEAIAPYTTREMCEGIKRAMEEIHHRMLGELGRRDYESVYSSLMEVFNLTSLYGSACAKFEVRPERYAPPRELPPRYYAW